MTRVVVIDGHPDPNTARLAHALADAYAGGVRESGGEVQSIRLADLNFPLLRRAEDFLTEPDDAGVLAARQAIVWADHIVLVFPLWLGSAPSLVRAFFEQVSRASFVADTASTGWRPRLRGKSARVIVTMGMPAFIYRIMFGGHGVQSWKKSILGFAGVKPIRLTLFGMIGAAKPTEIARRIQYVRTLGRLDCRQGRRAASRAEHIPVHS